MKVEEWEVQEPLELMVDAMMTHAPDPTIRPVERAGYSDVWEPTVGSKIFDYRWRFLLRLAGANAAQSVDVDPNSNVAAPIAAMIGAQDTAMHEPANEAPAATPL